MTSYDVSLIVGVFAIGNFIAPFFTGKLMDLMGRKLALILLGILKVSFLIVLAYSTNLLWMLIARTITGIAFGGILVVLPVYISEVSDDHNRGKLGCLSNVFLPLGQLYGYSMGSFLSVKYFTLSCAVPLLVQTVLFLIFVPETPIYLLHKGRREAAVKSLEKYKASKSPQVIEKYVLMIECSPGKTSNEKKVGILSIFSNQATRRGFLIGAGICIIQMCTGIPVLLSYMGPIFEQAQSGISGNVTSILVGSLKVLVFFSVSNVVEKLGRKPLILFSSIFCCIPLFLLGLYFFLKEHNLASYQNFSWLPVASILFFIFSYSMGLGPIPFSTVSELFPTHIRSTAVSFLMLLLSIFNIIITTSFPLLSEVIGISGCMWIYSANCAFGAVFIYFIVPETKGKSFHEIQEMLNGNRNTSDKMIE